MAHKPPATPVPRFAVSLTSAAAKGEVVKKRLSGLAVGEVGTGERWFSYLGATLPVSDR